MIIDAFIKIANIWRILKNIIMLIYSVLIIKYVVKNNSYLYLYDNNI